MSVIKNANDGQEGWVMTWGEGQHPQGCSVGLRVSLLASVQSLHRGGGPPLAWGLPWERGSSHHLLSSQGASGTNEAAFEVH